MFHVDGGLVVVVVVLVGVLVVVGGGGSGFGNVVVVLSSQSTTNHIKLPLSFGKLTVTLDGVMKHVEPPMLVYSTLACIKAPFTLIG